MYGISGKVKFLSLDRPRQKTFFRFKYVASLFRVFQVIGFGLASYSILWEKGAPDSLSQTVTNLYQSGRFALNPEERAHRIADVIMNADISFCKSFWNLTEGPFLQVAL